MDTSLIKFQCQSRFVTALVRLFHEMSFLWFEPFKCSLIKHFCIASSLPRPCLLLGEFHTKPTAADEALMSVSVRPTLHLSHILYFCYFWLFVIYFLTTIVQQKSGGKSKRGENENDFDVDEKWQILRLVSNYLWSAIGFNPSSIHHRTVINLWLICHKCNLRNTHVFFSDNRVSWRCDRLVTIS